MEVLKPPASPGRPQLVTLRATSWLLVRVSSEILSRTREGVGASPASAYGRARVARGQRPRARIAHNARPCAD